MKFPRHFSCQVFLALSVLASVQLACAQDYPSQPIRLVIPSGIGTAPDILGRSLGVVLTEQMKQKFIFENRASIDAGNVAADSVAKSDADGYTLLLGNELTHATNMHITKTFPYDPIKDFTPIAVYCVESYVLAVNSAVPAKNVNELIAYAKTQGKAVTLGSLGPGITSELAAAAFGTMAGIDVKRESFPSTVPAVNALIDGNVQAMFLPLRIAKQHLDREKIKAIGIADLKRFSGLPAIAPIAESVTGFSVNGWFGIFGPANLPRERQKVLNENINKAIASQRLRSMLDRMFGSVAGASSPEDLAALVAEDLVKREKLVKAAGLQP